jgi:hypothetical protein
MPGGLSHDDWHTMVLEGRLRKGNVCYENLVIDGVTNPVNAAVGPVAVGREEDRLAIGVQLDANANGDAYDVVVDNVEFKN